MTSTREKSEVTDPLDELEELVIKRDIFKAKKLSATLLEENPSDPRLLTLAAHTSILEGDIKRAKEQAELASSAKGDNIKAGFLLGFCCQSLGEYKEAVRVYGKVAKKLPDNPVAHLFLAESLLKAGMKEDAIRSYRKAAEVDRKGDLRSIAEEQILKIKDAV